MDQQTVQALSLEAPTLASLDQLAQQPAQPIACANWAEFPDGPNTTFRIGIIDNAIALQFNVEETNPRVVNHNDLEPVWEDSAVEFFCQVPGQPHYFNFEFNSAGVCLASSRLGQHEGVEYFTPEQLAQIQRIPSATEDAWQLTLLIPISLITDDASVKEFKCNFYKCGDETDHPHYLSWSPISNPTPAFHRPQFFGTLTIK